MDNAFKTFSLTFMLTHPKSKRGGFLAQLLVFGSLLEALPRIRYIYLEQALPVFQHIWASPKALCMRTKGTVYKCHYVLIMFIPAIAASTKKEALCVLEISGHLRLRFMRLEQL